MSANDAQPPAATEYNPGATAIGRLVAWVFGLAPAALFVFTWSENFNLVQLWLRAMAVPVVAAEAAVIFISFREGLRIAAPQRFPVALLAILGTIMWVTAATGPFPVPGLLRAAIWTVHLFFALAVVNLWYHRMLDFDEIRIAVLVGFVVVFVMLIAFVATTEQIDAGRSLDLPAFGNVRWYGEYACPVIALSALGFLRRDRLSLAVAAAAFTLAFWTGTRGAVAAVVVGLVVCTILFHEFRSGRVWMLFLSSGFAGFLLAFGLDTLVPFAGQGPDSLARGDMSGRLELWRDTWNMVLDRPLFGHGDGQFRWVVGQLALAQPHNVVLQVLYSWGFVGGMACLGLAIWLAPRFLKARDLAALPYRYAVFAIAAHSLVDGSLYHVHATSLFALCCAMAVAAGLSERAGHES